MAVRNLRYDGDDILRKTSKPVKEITPRVAELIDDLSENLKEYNGVGLAAVQVGVLKRIAVINVPEFNEEGNEIEKEDIVMINPEVEVIGEENQTGFEGCLSIPERCAQVTRPMHILLKAYDKNMEYFELEAEGLLARAIQHERDHMDGILYKDKAESPLYTEDEIEQMEAEAEAQAEAEAEAEAEGKAESETKTEE